MSIFSMLDFEGKVQVGDKTRLNASKSFVIKGQDVISELTIKAGVGAGAVSVYDTDPNERYLDWVYESFSIDIDSTNNSLIFNEGGSNLTATIDAGSYTLTTLAAEIATQMDAVGSNTYTVSVSNSVITISTTSAFSLVSCEILSQLFFDVTQPASTSHESDFIEYGTRIIEVFTDNGTVDDTKKFYQKVYSVEGDRLFCSDQDLTAHEPELMKWCVDGRSSFKDVIRRSQDLIIAWLDEKGYVNSYQEKFTKFDIVDLEEVRQMSIFMTLRLIMQGLSNQTDDVFSKKAKEYAIMETAARQRVILRLDTNKDGIVDATEGVSIYSGNIFTR